MSIQSHAADIRDEFAFLDDWEMRYSHIIDLGRANPPLAPAERNEASLVRGCASRVWLVSEDGPAPDTLAFRAESDALIVSGLIAILTRLFSGASAEDILKFDIRAFLAEIGVTDALSAQRANGLAAMLDRIQCAAQVKTASL